MEMLSDSEELGRYLEKFGHELRSRNYYYLKTVRMLRD